MLKKITSKISWMKTPIVLAISLSVAIAILSCLYFYNQFYPKEIALGIITDIHAGDQKYRDDGLDPNNILFPVNYEKNVNLALAKLKDADIILALGDNMNRDGREHARKLKELTKDYFIIWTRGNHDKKNEFLEIFSEKNYYYIDKGSWRMIVLDNAEKSPTAKSELEENARGFIDPEQMSWLEKALKTRKDIVISMHVPMFRQDNPDEIRPDYLELEKLFSTNGNVRYVFSGHFHTVDFVKKLNGVEYHIIPSLSLENHEGQFKKITISPEK